MSRRVSYKACFWLYAAWFAYMFIWAVSCCIGMPDDGFIHFLDSCAVPRLFSYYLYVMLIFTGFEIWMWLGALAVKIVCVLVLKDRGGQADSAMRRLRPLGFVVLAAHILMVLDAVLCASIPVLSVAGMMVEPNGAVVLIGTISFGLLFIGGIVWCGFCAIMAVASMPMVLFICKWFATVWIGAFLDVEM